jgi:K319-like protein
MPCMRLNFNTVVFLFLGSLTLLGCKKDEPTPQPPVANAGSDQAIQLPAASFTLSGSGTTPQGSITSYAWTSISGPNGAVINNPSSATTSVSGFIAGTYVFQLQVTNSSGLSATDNVTVVVNAESTSGPVANAGADQTIQLPISFFVLSGSGTTQKGTITGYSWSQISGPNPSIIDNPSSSTTSVSGFIIGTYVYQLQVTNSFGLAAKDTVVINLVGGVQTLTLQPTNNPDERHILGNSSGYDASTHAPELDAGAWTIGGVTIYVRGLFKFDLSSIPANATITSAKLSLYSNPTPLNGDLVNANSGPNNSMYIRRISDNWDPTSTVWSNQPATTTLNQVSIPNTSQSFLDLIDVDVKSLVIDMRSSGNYGFMILLQNEVIYNIRDFCSSTYPDAAKHPKLVVTYQ